MTAEHIRRPKRIRSKSVCLGRTRHCVGLHFEESGDGDAHLVQMVLDHVGKRVALALDARQTTGASRASGEHCQKDECEAIGVADGGSLDQRTVV